MIRDITVCFASVGREEFFSRYPEGSEAERKLEHALEGVIANALAEDFSYFILDMTCGICTLAGEILLRMQRSNPKILIEAAIPADSRISGWTIAEKRRYYDILASCDLVHYVQRKNRHGAAINAYLAEHARRMIYMPGKNPVLSATVRFAQDCGLELLAVDASAE